VYKKNQDYPNTIYWLETSFNLGNIGAANSLALLYHEELSDSRKLFFGIKKLLEAGMITQEETSAYFIVVKRTI